MAAITPQRLFDFRPRWTTIGAPSRLAVDEKRGRVLAASRRIEAISLDDGSSTCLERPPMAHQTGYAHFTSDLSRAFALVGRGDIVQWDLESGDFLSCVATDQPLATLEAIDPTGSFGLLLICEGGVFRMLSSNARVLLVDLQTGAQITEVVSDFNPATDRAAAFLEDGRILIASRTGHVDVRDAKGDLLHGFDRPPREGEAGDAPPVISSISVSGGVVLLSEMMSLMALDPENGALLWESPLSPVPGQTVVPESMGIVVRSLPGFYDSHASGVLDPRTGKETRFTGIGWHTATASKSLLAGADNDGNLTVVRPGEHTAALARPMDRLSASPSALALRADGAVLLGADDGSLRAILPSGALRALPSHGSTRISLVQFLEDGRRAITLSPDIHRTWRVDGWTLEDESLFPNTSGDLLFSPGGAHFFSVKSGAFTVRTSADAALVAETVLEGGQEISDFSLGLLDGASHVVGLFGPRVLRWNVGTGRVDAELVLEPSVAEQFAHAAIATAEPAGRRVLLHSAPADFMLLWNPDSGESRQIPGIANARRVLFADANRAVVIAERPSEGERTPWTERVFVVRLSDGAVLGEFLGHEAEVTALGLGGDRIVSADAARQVAIWRLPPA